MRIAGAPAHIETKQSAGFGKFWSIFETFAVAKIVRTSEKRKALLADFSRN